MTQRLGSARGKRGDRNLVGSHGRRDEHWPHNYMYASKLVETRAAELAAALPTTVTDDDGGDLQAVKLVSPVTNPQ
jgi:hypothetical protein